MSVVLLMPVVERPGSRTGNCSNSGARPAADQRTRTRARCRTNAHPASRRHVSFVTNILCMRAVVVVRGGYGRHRPGQQP